MKKRVIVLDTNVLLHDPESPLHFANENVVIPIQVVEKVDRFKRDLPSSYRSPHPTPNY